MPATIWRDRKRTFFGLPWSFTRYTLTGEKLIVDVGFLRRREDEVRLYRIMDITLKRSLSQRIFGIGTIHCCSADKTTPEFDLKNIKNPVDVKNLLSDLIEEERAKKRVSGREFMSGDEDIDGFDDGFDAH